MECNGISSSLATPAAIGPGACALDLGRGAGATLPALHDAAMPDGHIVGLDRMPQAGARTHGAQVQGDVIPTPFVDGSFDAIICQNVIECVADRPAVIAEARRLLKPGDRLLPGTTTSTGS